jgi:hypothetical protein
MPEYKELTVSLVVNQDAELRTVIGALVQQLEDRYILVEQDDGDLGVLNVADLAWLPYGKALADLDQYFLPTYKVNRALHTDDEIRDAADAHSDEVGLLYHGDEFEMLIGVPPDLGGGSAGRCQRVRCQNCQFVVVLCGNRRICPICGKHAV